MHYRVKSVADADHARRCYWLTLKTTPQQQQKAGQTSNTGGMGGNGIGCLGVTTTCRALLGESEGDPAAGSWQSKTKRSRAGVRGGRRASHRDWLAGWLEIGGERVASLPFSTWKLLCTQPVRATREPTSTIDHHFLPGCCARFIQLAIYTSFASRPLPPPIRSDSSLLLSPPPLPAGPSGHLHLQRRSRASARHTNLRQHTATYDNVRQPTNRSTPHI